LEEYKVPIDLFDVTKYEPYCNEKELEIMRRELLRVLEDAGMENPEVGRAICGPSVTTYEVRLPRGYGVHTFLTLTKTIENALHMKGVDCYVDYENGVGCIALPSKERTNVDLVELWQEGEMAIMNRQRLPIALGKDTKNRNVFYLLDRLGHMIIGGKEGSGKRTFLHSLICSLLYQYSPKEVRFVLFGTRSGLDVYSDIPHLMTKSIITLPREGVHALSWLIEEMDRRYELLTEMSSNGTYVVNVDQYNDAVEDESKKLPKIVVVIEEFAYFKIGYAELFQQRIMNLKQKARAVGIIVILATKRTNDYIITKPIRINTMTTVCFQVDSKDDSYAVIERGGAETLLGAGDFIYETPGLESDMRLQGAYISRENIKTLVDYLKFHYQWQPYGDLESYLHNENVVKQPKERADGIEPLYIDVLRFAMEWGSVSISMVQRRFDVGYNKAGKIVEWMEEKGHISPFDGAKARRVLITQKEFHRLYERDDGKNFAGALKIVVESGDASIYTLQRKGGYTLEETRELLEKMEKKRYITAAKEGEGRKVLMTKEQYQRRYGND